MPLKAWFDQEVIRHVSFLKTYNYKITSAFLLYRNKGRKMIRFRHVLVKLKYYVIFYHYILVVDIKGTDFNYILVSLNLFNYIAGFFVCL